MGGRLYFNSEETTGQRRLWSTDGSQFLTRMVSDRVTPTTYGGRAVVGNDLYFLGDDGGGAGISLWKTDGTDSGTRFVKDINVGSTSLQASHLTSFKGKLYFWANDGSGQSNLWRSDGTAAGTVKIPGAIAISPGNEGQPFVALGSLFVPVVAPGYGEELWKIDGTTGGSCKRHQSRARPFSD
jgi:ELWxxDGT repeat protein